MDRMSRVSLITFVASLLPAVAGAQVAPPAPPAPPAPRAPMAAPVMAPPAPMEIFVPPVFIDTEAVQDAVQAARAAVAASSADVREAARAASAQARDEARAAADMAREAGRVAPMAPMGWIGSMDFAYQFQDSQSFRMSSDSNYSQGISLLTQHQYENAIIRFDRVIAAKNTHADGALYYKAWALSKLGRSDDAVAAINELKRSYGSSAYLGDARTLEANVKKLGPEQVDDDDIKLLAIQGIQYSDPEKAVSVCEAVLNGANSIAVKKRAIYTLALIDRPEAHQLLLGYAKGKGNPELQREAINYLGARSAKQPTKSTELIDIYSATPDVDVRMAVIQAFRSAGDKSSLISIASGQGFGRGVGSGQTVTIAQADQMGLRSRAINNLSDLATPQELWPLYQKEENKDLRGEWVSTFSSMHALDQLEQIVKVEKDPDVRARAIRALGNQKSETTGTTLSGLYASGDKDTKTAVIQALSNQNNAEGLIAIARKETDKDLKVAIIRRLVDMASRSKAAADYLMEVVK
jgi:HEAT repeat protein